MKISSAFPSKYLKASDIPDGRQVQAEIACVEMEPMENGDDAKPVVYFRGKQKGLVLNRTNAETIAHAYGDDTDGWVGRHIIMFATTTAFGGRTVPCLRVRVPRATATPAAAPPAPPADVDCDPIDAGDVPF